MDLDLRSGDVAVTLGLAPERTLVPAGRRDDLAAMVTPYRPSLDCLLAPVAPGMAERLEADGVGSLFAALARAYDVVVVDAPAAFTGPVVAALDRSDHHVLVTTPIRPALSDCAGRSTCSTRSATGGTAGRSWSTGRTARPGSRPRRSSGCCAPRSPAHPLEPRGRAVHQRGDPADAEPPGPSGQRGPPPVRREPPARTGPRAARHARGRRDAFLSLAHPELRLATWATGIGVPPAGPLDRRTQKEIPCSTRSAGPVRTRSGFTLIELLIVIVILGVLAGVVVFAVGGITDTADVGRVQGRRRRRSPIAAEAYYAKNGSLPRRRSTALVTAAAALRAAGRKYVTVGPATADGPASAAPTCPRQPSSADSGEGRRRGRSTPAPLHQLFRGRTTMLAPPRIGGRIDGLLDGALGAGGTDLLLTAGLPPQLRVDGDLSPVDGASAADRRGHRRPCWPRSSTPTQAAAFGRQPASTTSRSPGASRPASAATRSASAG